jgi:rhamnulokinase
MEPPTNQKALIAVDLGAQSCRVSLLRWNRVGPEIQVVHRFANEPRASGEELRWDIHAIWDGVRDGIQRCCALAPEGIASIAVDGWAVDYVRLDREGNPVALPFCYRDVRTEEAEARVHSVLPASRLYSLTGIQILRINTLYQLYADKLAGFDPSLPWLNLPEYILYRLCGKRVSEFTNATHTGLVDLSTRSWCGEIFDGLSLHAAAAGEIVPSGTVLGEVSGELAHLAGLRNTKVIAPACHDTASAIAAIPAAGDDWAFISSGTWSLVGTVLDSPCISDEAHAMNFTNLGGVGGKVYFLKNVNGMWLLRQCFEEWESRGIRCSLPELLEECVSMAAPAVLINVDDSQLLLPGHVMDKINAQLKRQEVRGFAVDRDSAAAVVNLILHSMAARYAEVLSSIGKITKKKLKRLFIVGGGNQNALLNRLTAERTGIEIILGSTESTTIGNFAIQLAALGQDRNSPQGVTAKSVAQWAERIGSVELVQAHARRFD